MTVRRRDVMLAGLGLGALAGPRETAAKEADAPQPFSTYGVVPAGGAIDQTATLQEAADGAAQSGTPLFLPPGTYATSRLELKSGT
jgi:polygalacturonase